MIILGPSFGWVFKKIGQPTVIGEIIAGIVWAPRYWNVFSWFSAALFPVVLGI
jgi:Kef-type K+ transport system membrane component KefB